ncbi:hypothetical protein ACMHYB_22585 [Sorangium sp. So ce1128]
MSVAELYLKRHPRGAHAPVARDLVKPDARQVTPAAPGQPGAQFHAQFQRMLLCR